MNPDQALAVALASVGDNFDLLGEMPRAEGGSPVYFASDRTTGDLVALDLRPRGSTPRGEPYGLSVTSVLRRAGSAPLEPDSSPNQPTPPNSGLQADDLQGIKICPACEREYSAKTRFCPEDGSVLRQRAGNDDLIGEVIADRYEILRPIGEGGMGRVYLAEHVRIGQRCAVKIMNQPLSKDSGAISRFAREAASAGRIAHENVARVYDFGETREHGFYLAMEYVDGTPLSVIINQQAPFAVSRAVDLARQIANGLSAAHKENVVHRDLKPQNIVVVQPDQATEIPKVVDFGIAKAMENRGANLTRTGYVMGTPKYMSPEQLIGEVVDGRTDLYSLGCILYEMLAGAPPFSGAEPMDFMRRLTETPASPRQLNPSISAQLDSVVLKMLALHPKDRYQTGAEVREALDQAMKAPTPKAGRAWLPVPRGVRGSSDAAAASPRPSGPAARGNTPRSVPNKVSPVSLDDKPPAASATRDSLGRVMTTITPARIKTLLITAAVLGAVGTAIGVAVSWDGKNTDVIALPPVAVPPPPAAAGPPSVVEPTPDPQGTVRLGTSLPRGALVRWNGRIHQFVNNQLQLPAGKYTVNVSADGYEPHSSTLQLEPGGNVIWSPVLNQRKAADPPAAAARTEERPPVVTQLAAGSELRPQPSSTAATAPLTFRQSVDYELQTRLREALISRNIAGLSGRIRPSLFEALQRAVSPADASPVNLPQIIVNIGRVQYDSTALKASFYLRIEENTQPRRTIFETTELEATLLQSENRFALFLLAIK